MTTEEIREAAKVMEAYANGKKIQYLDNNNKWIDAHNPVFDWYNCDYRIKPEPKYRPFKTQEECWQEMHNHSDFGWLTRIDTGNFEHINTVCQEKIRFAVSIEYYRYEDAFKYYKFPDGTPFGIKEEYL